MKKYTRNMKQPQKDLYALLGLKKGSGEKEVKAAYRKLAKRYHPDMHASKPEAEKKRMQEKFTELSEAHEILTDPKRKDIYDKYGTVLPPGVDPENMGGMDGHGHGGFTFASNMNDFTEFFSGSGFFGDAFGGGRRQGARRGGFEQAFFGGGRGGGEFFERRSGRSPDAQAAQKNDVLQYPLRCSLEEIYSGATKKLKIAKALRSGGTSENIITVEIKPGYKAGTKFTFPSAGNELPDGRGTDVQVTLEEKPHDRFARAGSNLIYEIPLRFKETLRGFRKTIVDIDGKTSITISSQDIKVMGEDEVISGHGLPDRTKNGRRGDLIVRTKVILDLTEREKEKVRGVLL